MSFFKNLFQHFICVDFLYAWFYGLLVLFFHQSPPVQCLLCVRYSVSSSVSFYFLSLHANQDHQQNLVDFTFPVSHVTMVSTYFFFILLTFFPTKKQGWYAFYIVCESCFIWTRKKKLCHLSHDRIKKKPFCTRGLYRV